MPRIKQPLSFPACGSDYHWQYSHPNYRQNFVVGELCLSMDTPMHVGYPCFESFMYGHDDWIEFNCWEQSVSRRDPLSKLLNTTPNLLACCLGLRRSQKGTSG